MPRIALGRVQRWMQAVVAHPGTVDDGIRSPAAAAEVATVEDVVRPSARLTASERVGIYHGMYLGRMVEALESDYPALQRLLGAKGFADLVRDYVQAHPSRSYTLNRLGDQLPEFVAAAPGLRRRGFCHDLARLELAMSQVFDEEDTPALTPEAIAAVPDAAWEGARLHPIAAFRLLAVRYPVNAYVDATQGDGLAVPQRGRQQGGVRCTAARTASTASTSALRPTCCSRRWPRARRLARPSAARRQAVAGGSPPRTFSGGSARGRRKGSSAR